MVWRVVFMPKMANKKREGLYSIPDILHEIKRFYKITTSIDDDALKKYIRRYINNNLPSDKTISYVPKKFLDKFFTDEKVKKHLVKVSERNIEYTNSELLEFEEEAYISQAIDDYDEKLIKANISPEDETVMFYDEADEAHRYLTVDELLAVNRKGLTRINELTPAEYDMLEDYRNDIVYEQETNARIASILKDKKLEIMITALFEDKFILLEEQLKEDISNHIRTHDLMSEHQLKDIHNYFAKK